MKQPLTYTIMVEQDKSRFFEDYNNDQKTSVFFCFVLFFFLFIMKQIIPISVMSCKYENLGPVVQNVKHRKLTFR